MKHLANQKSVGAPPIKGSVVLAKTKILWVIVYIHSLRGATVGGTELLPFLNIHLLMLMR